MRNIRWMGSDIRPVAAIRVVARHCSIGVLHRRSLDLYQMGSAQEVTEPERVAHRHGDPGDFMIVGEFRHGSGRQIFG
ncbi:hypothetical protein [Arthrobacter sp. RAF14]|uniref:hypothetical protein n=1 Tax=Arthrobacter sp. RAF14 TaxID=3233051 RepID=UPI003F919240